MYQRALPFPKGKGKSFFLWGPRQSGKTTLLKSHYSQAVWIDLLKSDLFAEYSARPHLLRERLLKNSPQTVVIDEVQKVPALLDEVQYLIQNHSIQFILSGSSARKLKRGGANLLGGRALRKELWGLVSQELDSSFELERILNHGYLPTHYDSKDPVPLLKAYCADYLKEEVFSEGLVRKLPPFSRFLELAALSDTEIINYETFARDVGIGATTIRSYFDILSDTLLGNYLPSYSVRPKRKVKKQPKFYFSDIGIVNYLAQRGPLHRGSELFGKAFENWIHHELKCYLSYHDRIETLSYWKLSSGLEVDFVIGHAKAAVEAKASPKIHSDHTKGLREFLKDHPKCGPRYIVSLERETRKTPEGITVLCVKDFCTLLWSGKLF